jgi:hypothetical protein
MLEEEREITKKGRVREIFFNYKKIDLSINWFFMEGDLNRGCLGL